MRCCNHIRTRPIPRYLREANHSLATASNFAGAAAIRFFLGFFESITGAVFVVITSNWWTRDEQAFRAAFWLGGTPVCNDFALLTDLQNLTLDYIDR